MRTNAVVLLMKMPSAADALISQPAITYGSAEPPVPPTTPCPDVNAESASIRIAGWLASALGATVRGKKYLLSRSQREDRKGSTLSSNAITVGPASTSRGCSEGSPRKDQS